MLYESTAKQFIQNIQTSTIAYLNTLTTVTRYHIQHYGQFISGEGDAEPNIGVHDTYTPD